MISFYSLKKSVCTIFVFHCSIKLDLEDIHKGKQKGGAERCRFFLQTLKRVQGDESREARLTKSGMLGILKN